MHKLTRMSTIFISFLALMALSAQELTVIKADRMLDVVTGKMVRNAIVVIEGNRIKSVGGKVPSGATIIDLGDVTLLPGFMDMHTHLVMTLTGDFFLRGSGKQNLTLPFGGSDLPAPP